jgi:hypothetical protein
MFREDNGADKYFERSVLGDLLKPQQPQQPQQTGTQATKLTKTLSIKPDFNKPEERAKRRKQYTP